MAPGLPFCKKLVVLRALVSPSSLPWRSQAKTCCLQQGGASDRESWVCSELSHPGPFTSLHFHEREKNLCVVEATVTWFLFR